MSRKRVWLAVLLGLVGLIAGTGLGLWYGWEVDPVEYTDTDLAHLHPAYRDDFILMVSKAYALDGDLGRARARMEMLALPDPADATATLAEQAIAQAAPPSRIRPLAQLADALGASRPAFAPYLSADQER
jgi:hypothetical protein